LTLENREPLRTCTGCRCARDKKELLRYVLSPENELTLDYNAKLPGRGCYVCPDAACLMKAIKQRAFQKSFKNNVKAAGSVEELVNAILLRAYEKIGSFISFSIRGKKAAMGTLAVEQDLKKGRVPLILLRSCMSENTVERWKSMLEFKGIDYRVIEEFETLESIIGGKKVIGIRDQGLAFEIIHEIDRVEKLQSGM